MGALQSAGAVLVEFEADEIAHEPPVRSAGGEGGAPRHTVHLRG
jgi:hypothetical protein